MENERRSARGSPIRGCSSMGSRFDSLPRVVRLAITVDGRDLAATGVDPNRLATARLVFDRKRRVDVCSGVAGSRTALPSPARDSRLR